MLNLIFLLSLFSSAVELPAVQAETFPVGATWIWAYSEFSKDTQTWNPPYLYEKYTVTQVKGDRIEIEMSSGSQKDVVNPAHHKFDFKIEDCLKTKTVADKVKPKNFTIQFYTKSFSPNWELVSSAHKNLPLIEKFNCTQVALNENISASTVLLGGKTWNAFALPWSESIYGSGDTRVNGIAVVKHFDVYYKFELVRTPQGDL